MLKLELCIKFFTTLTSTATTNIDGHPPQPNDADHSQLPRQYNNARFDNARVTTTPVGDGPLCSFPTNRKFLL
jgi:hypothetical protein